MSIERLEVFDFEAYRKEFSKEVLDAAASIEPETVIVFCYKDGLVSVLMSECVDTLKLIGALEAAKMAIWNGSDCGDEEST